MMGMFLIFILAFIVLAIILFVFLRIFFQRKVEFANQTLSQKEELNVQLQNEIKQLQEQKNSLIERSANAESKIEFLNAQYELYQALQADHQLLQNRFAKAEEAYRNVNEKLTQQKEELNQIGEKFKFEFRNLAQSIMEEKTAKFTEVNEQKMNAILNPFKTQLTDFKQKVEETYDKESKERFSLEKEVQRLVTMTQLVSLEANNLTTALKGNNKMQGNWGEMILESILENSGLVKNREFFLQQFLRDNAGNVIKDADGKGLQPDAMIVYPDLRRIIIDSKVSLIAWDEYVSQSDVEEQKKFLKEHIKSVRQHIEGLSRKNYPKYASALNYVLMFVPIEPAFLEALKTDTQLWKFAYDKNILLVSPTNLFAVLRIVADLWKVEQQSANAIAIAERAGSLYDKFANFIGNFEAVGKKITEADSLYNTAHKQLTSGSGNITNKIEELKKMGAKAEKQLPSRLLDSGEDIVE